MNLNRVIIIGRLAADPESRTTANSQEVVNLRVATNRVWNNQAGQKQEQVEFHSVVLWGRLAQIASQYLKKGGLVMIEGRLQTRSWVGTDNQKRSRTEIVAENIQLGPKSQSANANYEPPYSGGNSPSGNSQKFTSSRPANPIAMPAEEDIPIINEDEPVISQNEIEETTVDLKDIPF